MGPGVTPEDEPKLFQPFFTTKPVGKGTGLGLSVSYGIIESYGGTIGYHGQRVGRRHVLLRAAGQRAGSAPAIRRRDDKESSTPDDRPPLLHRSVSPDV